MAPLLAPQQLGVGTQGGCEAAVHATRRFLSVMAQDSIVVKLDIENVFNCLNRVHMIAAINYCLTHFISVGWSNSLYMG